VTRFDEKKEGEGGATWTQLHIHLATLNRLLQLNPESPQQNVKQVHNLQRFQLFLAQETCFIAAPESVSVQSIKVTGSLV
jgi:hypothetical protein